MINRAGAAAGLPHIHPHQVRHTLATQAINRGMSLEAIAARPGQLPAPATGRDSRQVLSEATDRHARLRTAYWPGDPAVRLDALASLIAQAEQLLPQGVHDARDQELTWTQTGELLNTTAATAARRYRNNP
jgi:hypothetical protein